MEQFEPFDDDELALLPPYNSRTLRLSSYTPLCTSPTSFKSSRKRSKRMSSVQGSSTSSTSNQPQSTLEQPEREEGELPQLEHRNTITQSQVQQQQGGGAGGEAKWNQPNKGKGNPFYQRGRDSRGIGEVLEVYWSR